VVVQLRAERLVVITLEFGTQSGDKSNHPGSAVDDLRRPPAETHDFLERFVFRVRLASRAFHRGFFRSLHGGVDVDHSR